MLETPVDLETRLPGRVTFSLLTAADADAFAAHVGADLERLVDADTRFHGDDRPAAAAPPQPAYQSAPPPQQYGAQPYQQQSYGYGQKPHKKRKSFFEELFD